MTAQQTAYSRHDPELATAYLSAQQAYVDAGRRACRDALELGCTGVHASGGTAFGARRLTGLGTATPNEPPTGWVWSKTRGQLVPRKGKPGEPARVWLTEHALPETDHRAILEQHGLPRSSHIPKDAEGWGSWRVMLPLIVVHDDTIWVLYEGTPGSWTGTDTPSQWWLPRRLSEFHAAKEAADAAVDADTRASA